MSTQELPDHHHMGPSSSDKWMNCPGSVLAEKDYEDTSSSYADEGSAAHELGEWTLKDPDSNCEDFLGDLAYTSEDGTEWYVTQEMVDYTQDYVDYVRGIVAETGGELFVETRVFIDRIIPSAYGTSDAIILTDDAVYVIDLKYGKGVRVYASDSEGKPNSQAMCYATGAFDEHDFGHITDIHVAIVQPRLDNISEHSVSHQELNDWVDWAHQKYLETLEDNPPRNPTEKGCQWCKAKNDCRPRADMLLREVIEDFDGFGETSEALVEGEVKDIKKMTKLELAQLNQRSKDIAGLLKGVKELLTEDALAGEKVPLHKLVAGNKKRQYIDEDKAQAAFARKLTLDVAAPRKLLTPPQIEKLKDSKGAAIKDSRLFKKHVRTSDGKPVLVLETDKRKEFIVETIEDDFKDYDSEPTELLDDEFEGF